MNLRPTRDPSFVGRERELAALSDALGEARLGRGGAVLVVGDPGVGKTALVRELAARTESVLFVSGRSGGARAGEPLAPWLEVLDVLCETSSAQNDLSALLVELQTPQERRKDERIDPETERYLLLQHLTNALRREAESRSLAIVLDDLHLADLASVRFAAQLVDTPYAQRVLLIATQRELAADADPELAASLARVARANRRIELAPFSRDEVAACAEALAKTPLERAEVDALHRRSGGNPFFVRELLRDAPDSHADARLPRTLAHLIDARVQTLDPEQRELVELAAVIGAEPPLALLERAANVARASAIARLDRAVVLGLLSFPPDDSDVLAFPHELVRDAIYANLSLSRRASLHAAVARALEAQSAGAAEPPWLELARHYGESDLADGALRAAACAEAAARRSCTRLAFEDAAAQFGAALHWLEFGPPVAAAREAELLTDLARAQLHAGAPSRAAQNFQEAVRVARAGDAREAMARAALELPGENVALLEEVLLGLPPGEAALRADLQIALAADLAATDPQRARATSDAAIALARRTKDSALLLRAVSSRAQLLLYPNDPREREAFAREEALLARSLRDRGAEVFAHYHAFANALARGDRAAVNEAAEACEAAAMALGHPMHRGHVAAALAARALWLGDLVLAEQFSDEAVRCLADHRSRELAFLVATSQRFVLRRFQGRLAELEPQLDAGLRDHPERLWFQCALGLLYAASGRDEPARASLARVAERCSDGRQIRLPAEPSRSINVALLAETCAYLRDAETAAALELELEIAGDGNVCLGSVSCVGSVQRYRGLVAHARGDHDEAIAFLEDAIEWEKHVGARALEAYAVVDCARVAQIRRAPGDDDLVRALAARAAQLAAELSMPGILAAARELAYSR